MSLVLQWFILCNRNDRLPWSQFDNTGMHENKGIKYAQYVTSIFDSFQIRAIAEIINAGIQPIQNLSVLQKYTEDGQKRQEWGKYWIDKGFTGKI